MSEPSNEIYLRREIYVNNDVSQYDFGGIDEVLFDIDDEILDLCFFDSVQNQVNIAIDIKRIKNIIVNQDEIIIKKIKTGDKKR